MASDGEELSEMEQLIADQVGEWSTNSNDAFTISLWQGEREVDSFNPEFTYPIYGEEEAIFGYQGLKISLAFAAHNLTPHLDVRYQKQFPPQGEIKATEVREPLEEFLPPAAFQSVNRKTALADAEAAKFIPPGEKLETFEAKDGTYEVWVAPLSDPRAKQILVNMQILVPIFIEGGTILELEYPWIVDRWKIFMLYQIDSSPPPLASRYVFAGYATSFQVFSLPSRGEELEASLKPHPDNEIDAIVSSWSSDSKPITSLSLPSRERISQFILLPSRQRSGLGSRLYSTVYNHLTAPSHITELTVEDPNEAFDDMRDIADLVHLRTTNSTFSSLRLPSSIATTALSPSEPIPLDLLVSTDTRKTLSKQSKIQPRQLGRLIEMQLLSTIPRGNRSTSRITRKEKSSNENDRQYYFWRLLVKERLYQHNRDSLAQLDREERVEKVEDAVEGVQMDYERLTDRADARQKSMQANGATGLKANGDSGKKRRKRVQIEEDEEDGGEAVEDKEDASRQRKKRVRAVVEDDEDGEEV
ncbi:putative histone acetyltransferase type B catalytic subunit [Elsinoe australis]|uniref:Histone acetyltransferase type B catalytic subunit n=1 Tax=Elsinoe australis TaxID=40998 RepID=A0A4U7AZX9_9PEZI|nr:putative histone acetyltransferase type B catalytic subunit [Elsinoe australis]